MIGLQGGRKAELDLGALMAKRASIAATALRVPPARPTRRTSSGAYGIRCGRWSKSGTIRPIMDRRLPMADAAQAHRLIESSDHVGKVCSLPP